MVLSAQVLLTVCMILLSLIGDCAVTSSQIIWFKAIADNATHGIIGLLTWLIVVNASKPINCDQILEVLVCGLWSSLIDVDHFIVAQSLHLQDARQITTRPFLHCTSLALASSIIVMMASILMKCPKLHRYSWVAVAAFLSHHTRDATRRGYWIWPWGHTPSLPYAVYVISLAILPQLIIYLIHHSPSPGSVQSLPSVSIV